VAKKPTIKANGGNGADHGARPAAGAVRTTARIKRTPGGLVWPALAKPVDAQALALLW
jgi:hypothetical protein